LRVYTLVQLGEVALFAAVLVYALLPTPDTHPSLAVAGGGLLVGKAVMNILAPEGGSVLRRTLIGYGVGAVLVLIGIYLIHR
jgi:hypothetical protein